MNILDNVCENSIVLLKNKRGMFWNSDGLMDMYKGQIVSIKTIDRYSDSFSFTIRKWHNDPSDTDWIFSSNDIEEVISLPFKVGDIVAYKNDIIDLCNKIYTDVKNAETTTRLTLLERPYTNITSLSLFTSSEEGVFLKDKFLSSLSFIGKIGDISETDFVTVYTIKHREYPSFQRIIMNKADLFHINIKGENIMKPEPVCTSSTCSSNSTTYGYTSSITSALEKLKEKVENTDFTFGDTTKHFPAIHSYEVYNNKTVVVRFCDGSVTKVTCSDNDTFDEEIGIEKCILKKVCGDNFKNRIQALMREKRKAIETQTKQKEAEEAEKKRREQKYLKNKERKFKRRVAKQAQYEVELALKKQEIIDKLPLTAEKKRILNESIKNK